jgi:glycerophosphoryl diester phosphodiesterase
MNLSLVACLALMSSAASATEIIAHRGFSARAPENTVASFKLAWENGTDACENDIYLTTDHQIVVIHDGNTKRTTGVSMEVSKSALADLLALDAGSWKGTEWTGEKLPTLQQALDTTPVGRQRFFVEIKVGPEIVPALQKVLEPMKARAAQLVVISFNRESAIQTKAAMPWLKVYLLASGKTKAKKPRTDLATLIEDAKMNHLDGLDLGDDWPWSEAMVKQIHTAGLGAFVWTVDKPERVQQLAAFGVDGVTTNDPVMARQALQAR